MSDKPIFWIVWEDTNYLGRVFGYKAAGIIKETPKAFFHTLWTSRPTRMNKPAWYLRFETQEAAEEACAEISALFEEYQQQVRELGVQFKAKRDTLWDATK